MSASTKPYVFLTLVAIASLSFGCEYVGESLGEIREKLDFTDSADPEADATKGSEPDFEDQPEEIASSDSALENANSTQSAPSNSAIDSEAEAAINEFIRSVNCSPPNEAEYLTGNSSIGWTIAGIRHEGVLSMEGRVGGMRITYFSEQNNATETVDQGMILANCPRGLVLLGVEPVFAETGEANPNYAADNLIFQRQPDGQVTTTNCDNNNLCVSVEVVPLEE